MTPEERVEGRVLAPHDPCRPTGNWGWPPGCPWAWSNYRVPRRLQPANRESVATAEQAYADGTAGPGELRLLVKHYLALLQERAPGKSVEVRVPPYAAVQVVPGVRHTRGTPPAVVELDAETWLDLATGRIAWSAAEAAGAVHASGERADLSAYLPLS